MASAVAYTVFAVHADKKGPRLNTWSFQLDTTAVRQRRRLFFGGEQTADI